MRKLNLVKSRILVSIEDGKTKHLQKAVNNTDIHQDFIHTKEQSFFIYFAIF